jgi:hypothetical protein
MLNASDMCHSCRLHKKKIDYIHAMLCRLIAMGVGMIADYQNLGTQRYINDTCDSALT